MTTLKDVVDLINSVEVIIKLVGATAEFKTEYYRRLREIGSKFALDQGLTEDDMQGMMLSDFDPNTSFGEESERHFVELKD